MDGIMVGFYYTSFGNIKISLGSSTKQKHVAMAEKKGPWQFA